jgi:hypothetical protein
MKGGGGTVEDNEDYKKELEENEREMEEMRKSFEEKLLVVKNRGCVDVKNNVCNIGAGGSSRIRNENVWGSAEAARQVPSSLQLEHGPTIKRHDRAHLQIWQVSYRQPERV